MGSARPGPGEVGPHWGEGYRDRGPLPSVHLPACSRPGSPSSGPCGPLQSPPPSQAQGLPLLGELLMPTGPCPGSWLGPAPAPPSLLTMAAGPRRSGEKGPPCQVPEVEWQGQDAQQPDPRFSPWQESLVSSRGGHGLQCQERAWPGRSDGGDIKWAWGHLEPRLAILSSKALVTGHAHFAFLLVRLAPRNNLAWWEAEGSHPGGPLPCSCWR